MRRDRLSWATPADHSRPIDLHVHTTASDGSLSPCECVAEAARRGLAAIGIADHDTLGGHGEAMACSGELGVEVVPGVEVAATDGRRTFHLLGYYPEAGDGRLGRLLEKLRAGREERNPQILKRLAALGCPVSSEEAAAEAGSGVLGRPHIAAVMIRKGYVASLQEAFDRYLARGAPAYVERRKPPVGEVLGVLRGAHAVPVLAHPGTLGVYSTEEIDAVVRPLVEQGLLGLEAHYHAHTAEQAAACLRVAHRHGLVVTGGSDYHGASKPEVEMGRGTGRLHIPYRLLSRLKAARERL